MHTCLGTASHLALRSRPWACLHEFRPPDLGQPLGLGWALRWREDVGRKKRPCSWTLREEDECHLFPAHSLPALDLASPFLQEALWMSPRLGQSLTSYIFLRYGEERIGGG